MLNGIRQFQAPRGGRWWWRILLLNYGAYLEYFKIFLLPKSCRLHQVHNTDSFPHIVHQVLLDKRPVWVDAVHCIWIQLNVAFFIAITMHTMAYGEWSMQLTLGSLPILSPERHVQICFFLLDSKKIAFFPVTHGSLDEAWSSLFNLISVKIK